MSTRHPLFLTTKSVWDVALPSDEFHLDQGPWMTWTWRWMMCHGQCPWPSKNVQGMFSTWPCRRRREGWPPGKLLELFRVTFLADFWETFFDILAIFGWVGVVFGFCLESLELSFSDRNLYIFRVVSAWFSLIFCVQCCSIRARLIHTYAHRDGTGWKKNAHISVCLSRFGSNITAFSWLCVTLIRWLGGYTHNTSW